jgi:hypothetical protein
MIHLSSYHFLKSNVDLKARSLKQQQYPTSNSTALLLPYDLAMEIYTTLRDDVLLSRTIVSGFILEHSGQEVTAVYRVNPRDNDGIEEAGDLGQEFGMRKLEQLHDNSISSDSIAKEGGDSR